MYLQDGPNFGIPHEIDDVGFAGCSSVLGYLLRNLPEVKNMIQILMPRH